jgi:hypothetical protein
MSVYIHEGVAFFSSVAYPSERELHDAIELGLETEFPVYLERIDSGSVLQSRTSRTLVRTLLQLPQPVPASIPGGIQAMLLKIPKWKNLLVTRETMEK